MKTKIKAPQYMDKSHPNYLPLTLLKPHGKVWHFVATTIPSPDAAISSELVPLGGISGELLYQTISDDIQKLSNYLAERSDPFYTLQNDGIGPYEYAGTPSNDPGIDYILIEGSRDPLPTITIDLPRNVFNLQHNIPTLLDCIDTELASSLPTRRLEIQNGKHTTVTTMAQFRPSYTFKSSFRHMMFYLEINFDWYNEED